MNNFLHVLNLILFCFIATVGFSQQTRINSSRTASIDNSVLPTIVNTPNNEKKNIKPESKREIVKQNTTSDKPIADTALIIKAKAGTTDRLLNKQRSQERLVEKGDTVIKEQVINSDVNTTNKMVENSGVYQDNVTYTKETLPNEIKSNITEHKSTKVTTSVNYKPKVVREDVVPAANSLSNEINQNKRIYLQQEADDLKAEITKFQNNPDYDLVSKQKKLQEILDLLK